MAAPQKRKAESEGNDMQSGRRIKAVRVKHLSSYFVLFIIDFFG